MNGEINSHILFFILFSFFFHPFSFKRLIHSFNSCHFSYAVLDASTHLYKRVCPSIRRSVPQLVGNHFFFTSLLYKKSIDNMSQNLMETINTVHHRDTPPPPPPPPPSPLPSFRCLDASLFLLELVSSLIRIISDALWRCPRIMLAPDATVLRRRRWR